jgi:prefoldin subunit 5
LKNCGIIVEEDFSRAAKFRRKELEKLVKEIKQLSPEKKCTFK